MFLKNVFSYSIANAYAQLICILQEFFIRWVLPPEIMGFWSLLLVIRNFGMTFDMGVLTAATRELPILHGEKKLDKVVEYRIAAFWLHFLAKLMVSLGIIVYVFIYYSHPINLNFWCGLAASLIILLSS